MLRAIVVMLACFVLVTDCECRAWAKSKEKAKPVLERVYTMQDCPACDVLEALLVKKGVKLTHVCRPTRQMPVDAFPTCDYSDGVSDVGARVKQDKCRYGASVLVILWTPPKEKETK